MRTRLVCLMLSAALFSLALPSRAAAADPAPPAPKEIWLVRLASLTPGEQALAVSLQGLVARREPAIWIEHGGMTRVILNELKKEGTKFNSIASVWELLDHFKADVKGAVIYKFGTPSVNVATSLCGALSCVAVEESILEAARSHGLEVQADARTLSEREAFEKYRERFTHGIAVEQKVKAWLHLRDFAIQRGAFTFWAAADHDFRTQTVRALGPAALVYGWGPDERDWVAELSQAGAAGIASDWCLNLSVMGKLPASIPERPRRTPAPVRAGERIVAFVMTDGDNVQWMTGGFNENPGFWASPRRGTFNMTWELAPGLATLAPRALRYLYNTASRGQYLDDFICGPSGAGYTFPAQRPDRPAFDKQTAEALSASRLSIVSSLDWKGDMTQAAEMLDRPEVLGIIYKDYAPYHRYSGKMIWRNGKPCVSYTHVLWENNKKNSPEGVAAAIAKLPTDPAHDPRSYAIVNVHAWSWKAMGGPMEATKKTIDLLPTGTRVVTAEELIILLRNNFGTPVK